MRWWVFWTILFIIGGWWDYRYSALRWRIHRPVRKVERTVRIKPIVFRNASVMWINTLSDEINLDLVDVAPDSIGTTSVEKIQMHVYNDIHRTQLAEIYDVDYNVFEGEQRNYSFLQTDIHLSPFRRIIVYPRVEWDIGMGWCEWCFPRQGFYQNGWWVEPIPWRWAPWLVVWGTGIAASRTCGYRRGRSRRVRFT